MFSPKKILVPTDYSEFSDNALEQALDIAKQHKAKVYLFHVIGLMQQCAVDYCLDNATVMDLDKKSMKSAKDMMQEQIRKVSGSADVEIISDVRKGSPYEEILKEEKARKIDLIVIGSHGKTGILSHLMGSVAEKVARGAKCPVLIVRVK
jgi:nucleotide-binding universal stress UspA family protein